MVGPVSVPSISVRTILGSARAHNQGLVICVTGSRFTSSFIALLPWLWFIGFLVEILAGIRTRKSEAAGTLLMRNFSNVAVVLAARPVAVSLVAAPVINP